MYCKSPRFAPKRARALDGQISMIAAFYRLGVRSMLLAHNANNEFSAGCIGDDTGLTPLGLCQTLAGCHSRPTNRHR